MQNVTPQSAPTVATATGRVRNNHRLLGALLALMALLLLPLTASAEAIPALNVLEVSDDGTEYSLSLQLLLLMTVLALVAINSDFNDLIHTHYYRAVAAATGARHSSDSSKSGVDWYRTIFVVVHHGTGSGECL